jgi:hypothetical protein
MVSTNRRASRFRYSRQRSRWVDFFLYFHLLPFLLRFLACDWTCVHVSCNVYVFHMCLWACMRHVQTRRRHGGDEVEVELSNGRVWYPTSIPVSLLAARLTKVDSLRNRCERSTGWLFWCFEPDRYYGPCHRTPTRLHAWRLGGCQTVESPGR